MPDSALAEPASPRTWSRFLDRGWWSPSMRLRAVLRRAGYVPATPEVFEDDFLRLYRQARPFTMTSTERMYALWLSSRYIRDIPGDVVECGVWRGGSSMLAALTLAEQGDERRVWLYDTFEGMPDPTPQDVDTFGMSAHEDWERLGEEGEEDGRAPNYASLEEVQGNLRDAGIPEQRVRFVQGKVEDTIPAQAPERIALLRLDTDWYESTLHELEHLWPRLAAGGVLLLDDYGHWQGARRAVDEFFANRSDAPLLNRIDYTGRVGVKR